MIKHKIIDVLAYNKSINNSLKDIGYHDKLTELYDNQPVGLNIIKQIYYALISGNKLPSIKEILEMSSDDLAALDLVSAMQNFEHLVQNHEEIKINENNINVAKILGVSMFLNKKEIKDLWINIDPLTFGHNDRVFCLFDITMVEPLDYLECKDFVIVKAKRFLEIVLEVLTLYCDFCDQTGKVNENIFYDMTFVDFYAIMHQLQKKKQKITTE